MEKETQRLEKRPRIKSAPKREVVFSTDKESVRTLVPGKQQPAKHE